MARGGYRPGAGRPRKDGTKGPEKADATAINAAPPAPRRDTAPVVSAFDIQDPAFILSLVVQGEDTLPSGKPITSGMIAAAKELLPYYKAKLSTTSKLTDNRGPPEEVPTEDLRRERLELIRALAALDREIAGLEAGKTDSDATSDRRGERTDPQADSEDELFGLLR